jgi:xylobiose transport system permease protein
VLFFVAFAAFPMVLAVALSFTHWSGLGTPRFIGLANWRNLAHDPELTNSLKLSAYLTIFTWVLQTAIALPLGVWAAGPQRNRAALASVFFVPLLLSSAALGVLWRSLLDPNFGLAHQVGPWLGITDGNFLRTQFALFTVGAIVAWQFVPFHTLLYQSASKQIPEVLYEAARIDGAGRYRSFFSVTLPQLRHTIVTSSVIMIVGSLTYFDIVLIVTNGGPGTATRILPLHMYLTGFSSFDMGYASVLAVLLLGIGTVLSLVIVRVTGLRRMSSQREGL